MRDCELSTAPLRQQIQDLVYSGDSDQIKRPKITKGKTEQYEHLAYSENTWKSYESSLNCFIHWVGINLPFPVTSTLIIKYLFEKADELAPTTLSHHVSAISFVHHHMGAYDPTKDYDIRLVLKGIEKQRRKKGWKVKHAPILTAKQFKKIILKIENDRRGLRDRTLLLIGLTCALVQNEISNMQIEDFEKSHEGGYIYRVKRSQVEHEGTKVRYKVIPYGKGKLCPVKAIDQLIESVGEMSGPLFRGISRQGNYMRVKDSDGITLSKGMSHTSINQVLKKRIDLAGVILETDPAQYNIRLKEYSFQTLRSSFISILINHGVPEDKIRKQTHKAKNPIFSAYDMPCRHFKDSPAYDLMAILAEA